MTTLLLVRHGRTSANVRRILVGRTAGVLLDEVGQAQAEHLAHRLSNVKLALTVTSPLQRCQLTLEPLTQAGAPEPIVDDRLIECEYGTWTGQELDTLAKDPLWQHVQDQPSTVRFPDGESIVEMQARAVAAVHDWNATVRREHGDEATWLVCSHEDVIKSILASLLGIHLDLFQRITVVNAALTEVRFVDGRPYLLRLNAVDDPETELA